MSMTETRTDLRQADAFVSVEGILSEKKLEMTANADGSKVIRGSLVVKTNDTNFVTLNVYVSEKTSKGEPNRAYEGMMTVLNEYKSIAEVGEEEATKLSCNRVNLHPNTYIDRTTFEEMTNVRYSASFVSRVNEAKYGYNPHATFEVEAFIASIIEEVDKEGEPTGRLKMMTYVPTYKGVEPMTIVVPKELADDVNNVFETNQTARFYGELKNNVIIHENVIKLAIGGSKIDSKKEITNEIVLTGATEPYEEEKAYSYETIQKGLVERELRLKKDKDDLQNAKKPAAPMGGGIGGMTGGPRPIPKFSM